MRDEEAEPPPGEVTQLLQRAADGDEQASHDLYERVYSQLHDLARGCMQRQVTSSTLQPTALVHEAWMRLARPAGGGSPEWRDRQHFLAVAARAMRSVLVDRARRRNAEKRGGGRGRQALEVAVDLYEEEGVDLLALDEALERLAADEPRQAHIVELRFFGGLKLEEVAAALELSMATINRAWRMARIRLRDELRPAS